VDIYGEELRETSNRIAYKIVIISTMNLPNTSVVCTLGIFVKSVVFEE
jgi:hypothetical protein